MAQGHEPVTGWSDQHVCACYADAAQRDELLFDYVHAGVSAGARVVCLCYDAELDAFARRLEVDPWMAASLANGTIDLRIAEAVYAPAGVFDPDRMAAVCIDEHDAARAAGYAGLWMSGDLGWAVEHAHVTRELLGYEHRLATARASAPTLTNLCLYDAARTDDGLLAPIRDLHDVVVGPTPRPTAA